MQVEGQALQAPAQGVKRLVEAIFPRDSDTRARSSNEPDSGMDMNSTVTYEQCVRKIQSVQKELGLAVRRNFVEHSTWYGLNQGYVIYVTTMHQSGYLVQSKCVMMLNGPTPTLWIGVYKCEFNESWKPLQFKFNLYDSAANPDTNKIPNHDMRNSSRSCQT